MLILEVVQEGSRIDGVGREVVTTLITYGGRCKSLPIFWACWGWPQTADGVAICSVRSPINLLELISDENGYPMMPTPSHGHAFGCESYLEILEDVGE